LPLGMFVHAAIDRKLDPEFLEHGLRLQIGGQERDGLAVAERPVVNDLDDRVGPGDADVEYRHDVAILGNDVIVAEPCEIEHVGNTWQQVVMEERCYSLWVATQRSCRRRHAFKNRVACSTKSPGYWWCAP